MQVERSYYTSILEKCSSSIRGHYDHNGKFEPPPTHSRIPSNSIPISAHFSFDYAQQVFFPSNPLQPGPVYFLTTRKCSVFGINCEAIPRQVNILTDESGETGKGAKAVVSRVHHFLETTSLGEKHLFLHADNCTGQNKNNSMIQYLCWRVLTDRHTSITSHF